MSRIVLLVSALVFGGSLPAFAAGFSHSQFVLLVVVNLALGVILTLFAYVLTTALLEKLRPAKKIRVRLAARRR